LTESFDISSLPVSSQLYSIARDFSFWKDGSNYMGYPFSCRQVQIYYNPEVRQNDPGFLASLLDKSTTARFALETFRST